MLDSRVECVDRSPSKKQNSERVGIQGAETWRRVLWACSEVKARSQTAEALTASRPVASRTTASRIVCYKGQDFYRDQKGLV